MIFINNKYTRIYYAIVTRAKARVTTEFTESHHIIPNCFYKIRGRKGRPGWLEGNPNAPENLVYLTPHEHYVCHLLLTKMVDGIEAQHKVDTAAAWIADTYRAKNNGVRITGRVYAKLKTASAKAQSARKLGQVAPIKGMKLWNNGIINKMSATCPGTDFVLGSLICGPAKSHAKGKKYWNNGVIEKMSVNCPGPEFISGKLKSRGSQDFSSGKRKWNNGTTERLSVECPGPEFRLGSLQKGCIGSTAGTRAWTNGSVIKFSVDQPGPEFVLGRLKRVSLK